MAVLGSTSTAAAAAAAVTITTSHIGIGGHLPELWGQVGICL